MTLRRFFCSITILTLLAGQILAGDKPPKPGFTRVQSVELYDFKWFFRVSESPHLRALSGSFAKLVKGEIEYKVTPGDFIVEHQVIAPGRNWFLLRPKKFRDGKYDSPFKKIISSSVCVGYTEYLAVDIDTLKVEPYVFELREKCPLFRDGSPPTGEWRLPMRVIEPGVIEIKDRRVLPP